MEEDFTSTAYYTILPDCLPLQILTCRLWGITSWTGGGNYTCTVAAEVFSSKMSQWYKAVPCTQYHVIHRD